MHGTVFHATRWLGSPHPARFFGSGGAASHSPVWLHHRPPLIKGNKSGDCCGASRMACRSWLQPDSGAGGLRCWRVFAVTLHHCWRTPPVWPLFPSGEEYAAGGGCLWVLILNFGSGGAVHPRTPATSGIFYPVLREKSLLSAGGDGCHGTSSSL